MSSKVIGLYNSGWWKEYTFPAKPSRNPLYLLPWACWFKANPRTEDYMRTLFVERYPDGEFINTETLSAASLKSCIADAHTIVLLYPDAIGIGFRPLEKLVSRERNPMAKIIVLNGRKREFHFSGSTRNGLYLRRLAELTMITELCVGAVMLMATPFLAACDFLRGRK